MDKKIIFQSNRKSTQRMREIVNGLSEEELSQNVGDDWPIFLILAHLAFWDQRVIHVIEMGRKNNVVNAPLFDLQLNDILAPILRAIPPAEAAKMAINVAGSVDQLLEECAPEFIDEMMKVNNRLVDRSLHRNGHLDDIAAILKSHNGH
jgi:hypothetical protein